MVLGLIDKGPVFYNTFNTLLTLEKQEHILKKSFVLSREKWLRESVHSEDIGIFHEINKKDEEDRMRKGKAPSKSFFEKNWTWKGLVPSKYRRTQAPRITASGGTLHAMKKDMSKMVVLSASEQISDSCFMDLDFSACHAHIAASLYGGHSLIRELKKLCYLKKD